VQSSVAPPSVPPSPLLELLLLEVVVVLEVVVPLVLELDCVLVPVPLLELCEELLPPVLPPPPPQPAPFATKAPMERDAPRNRRYPDRFISRSLLGRVGSSHTAV
jgi:hypothetical protein